MCARHVVWSFKSRRLAAVVLEGMALVLSHSSAAEKTWLRNRPKQVGRC